jgi:hypothetical protein
MRVAETRAVNRALRKAYGIGLCSVEELGWVSEPRSRPLEQFERFSSQMVQQGSNGSNGSPSRLRDKLCLLIRQYNLDPTLVKATPPFLRYRNLKEASRDLVESFISHLASSAKEDIDGLICKLNSYAQPCGGETMKRHIPGLHSRQQNGEVPWKACSWFASNGPPTAGIRKRLSCRSDSLCWNLKSFERRSFSGRLYSTERALWKLNWFLRDFGYDMELLTQDQMDEKALVNLRGVVGPHIKP